ncbi:MAG: glycoside hydrolase [Calditrichaeota bacterium]|nr:MAG: glycoside hydrolase [Calditrichota bacterium]
MMFSDTTRLGRPFAKDPHVIIFQGRYLMYYSIPGYLDSEGVEHGWGIGIAESYDLEKWKRIGEVNRDPEATYEAKGFAAPCALVVDGRVNLFYQTYGNGRNDAICHAWSIDGVHFLRNDTNPIFKPVGQWNAGRAIDADVIHINDRFLLYYATRDPEMKVQMLGVAVATAPTDFRREDWHDLALGKPILRPELPWERDCIEAPSVVVKNGIFILFYAGGYNNAPQQIGVAQSTDGVRWTRLAEQPLLANGQPGTWNSSESGHPHLFSHPDGEDYLFFQGNHDQGNTWFISKVKINYHNNRPTINQQD